MGWPFLASATWHEQDTVHAQAQGGQLHYADLHAVLDIRTVQVKQTGRKAAFVSLAPVQYTVLKLKPFSFP